MAGVPSGTGRSERILPPLPYPTAEAGASWAQHAAAQLAERRRKRGYVDVAIESKIE